MRTLLCALLLVASTPSLALGAQVTERVSLAPGGVEPDVDCEARSMSADARYVAFETYSPLFVANDNNANSDVFVLDRVGGAFERVSVAAAGGDADGHSHAGMLSADGGYVVFTSTSTNLIAGSPQAVQQVYRRERSTGVVVLVSRSTAGVPDSGGASYSTAMTPDARYVLITSHDSSLTGAISPSYNVLFVRDIDAGTTVAAALGFGGAWPDGEMFGGRLSDDGRYVAFESSATNLVAGDAAGHSDVFRCDRQSGLVTRVSVGLAGAEGNAASYGPSMSSDGRFVAFKSYASNLVPNDTNQGGDNFVRDLQTAVTERVSLDWLDQPLSGDSGYPQLSPDGRFVLFPYFGLNATPNHDSDNGGNVVVRDRLLGRSTLASVNSNWEDGDIGAEVHQVTADGRFVLMSSFSTNLVPGDTNGVLDVYLRDRQQTFPRDLDGDGWGDTSVLAPLGVTPPAGYTDLPFDCDDSSPSRYPGALELCNGLDDDCDNVVDESYDLQCDSYPSLFNCSATLTANGTPSASATSGFVISASGLNSQRTCAVIYSFAQSASPTAGARCVGLPFGRAIVANSGGSANVSSCDGTVAVDWLAFMAAHPNAIGHPLTAGQAVYAQAVARDAGSFQFSQSIRFAVCP